jgi:hypothetical protein
MTTISNDSGALKPDLAAKHTSLGRKAVPTLATPCIASRLWA